MRLADGRTSIPAAVKDSPGATTTTRSATSGASSAIRAATAAIVSTGADVRRRVAAVVVVGVLVGDQHGVDAVDGLGVGEPARVHHHRRPVVREADAGVPELGQSHAPILPGGLRTRADPTPTACAPGPTRQDGGVGADGVRLRAATPDDVGAGAELHRRCWAETYRGIADPAALERGSPTATAGRGVAPAARGGPGVHVAEVGGALVGFALVGRSRMVDAPTPTELHALYVRRSHHGTASARDSWTPCCGPSRACCG